MEYYLDVTNEEKVINILGYKIIKGEKFSEWSIVDHDDNPVGNIKYNKIKNASMNRGVKAKFGYTLRINTDEFKLSKQRDLTNPNDSLFKIELKDNDDYLFIELDFSEFPSISLKSKDLGFLSFNMSDEELYLNYKSKTENYIFEETLTITKKLEYGYVLAFASLGEDFERCKSTYSIWVSEESGLVTIDDTYLDKGIIVNSNSTTCAGNIVDAISCHKFGINAFKHFRYIVNNLGIFDEEVLEKVVNPDLIDKEIMDLLMPDLKDVNLVRKIEKQI